MRSSVRFGITTVDQAISSLTSAAISFAAARSLDVSHFGQFAVSFSLYVLILGLIQGVCGQVYLIHHSGADTGALQTFWTSCSLAFGLGGLVALFAYPWVGWQFLALLVVIAPVVGQDTLRSVFFGRSQPHFALVIDAVWLSAVGGIWLLVETEHLELGPEGFVVAWGLGAVAACLLGLYLMGGGSRPTPLREQFLYVRDHKSTSGPLVVQMLVALGALQASVLLMGTFVGVAAVGAFRGAQTLMGPINIVALSASQFAVPELVRRRRDSNPDFLRWATALSGGVSAVVAVWGATWYFLPASIGEALLGDTWSSAREVVPVLTIFIVAGALTTGPSAVFKAFARTDLHLKLNLAYGPILLILSSVIAWRTSSVQAAVSGLAAAAALMIPVWWGIFFSLVRSRKVVAP